VPAGTDVVLTGWGDTLDTLHQVTLQITSDSECKNTYYEGMGDSAMCAGDPNGVKGESVPDRGGPLVASNRLVGIFAVGYEDFLPTKPGVYTKVAAVCDWIVFNAGL